MTTFYTSDHHFGHYNIIKYCNRYVYCQTVEEMNQILIDKWNSVISEKDIVVHLGDVYFKNIECLDNLNGRKYLILGNHDIKNEYYLKRYFTIMDTISIEHDNKLVLSHYPIKDWPHKYQGYLHLHGHSHGTVDGYDKDAIDVGVDCWDGFPITINQIRARRAERYARES